MEGVRLKYNITDDLVVKAFTGKQKGAQENRFETSPQIIKGINAEQSLRSADGSILNLGVSAVNRTLDENTMTDIVTQINGQPLQDRFYPKYNVYILNGYFNASYKDFAFNGEYNYKTEEAINNNEGKRSDQ